ncbi:MAG: helix-turn-helix domain-containing protein [Gemmatimonadales bacterium]
MQQLELAPVRIPNRGTQHYELLTAMQQGKRLTVAIALTEHGVYALSQRIGELKRMGWPIHSRTVEVRSGARISEYWMPL